MRIENYSLFLQKCICSCGESKSRRNTQTEPWNIWDPLLEESTVYLLLVDELSELVVPEVERLGMSSCETFYSGHPAQGDSDQLVGDP